MRATQKISRSPTTTCLHTYTYGQQYIVYIQPDVRQLVRARLHYSSNAAATYAATLCMNRKTNRPRRKRHSSSTNLNLDGKAILRTMRPTHINVETLLTRYIFPFILVYSSSYTVYKKKNAEYKSRGETAPTQGLSVLQLAVTNSISPRHNVQPESRHQGVPGRR